MATESEVKAAKEIADETDRLVDSTAKVKTNVADIKDSSTGINGVFKTMQKNLSSIANIFGAANILAGLDDIVKDAWDMDKSMTHLAVQMGKMGKMGPGVDTLKKATTGLMTELGLSYEKAKATVETLGQSSYVGNIEEAARASAMFAKATGTGYENAAELADSLSKFGKLGETQIKTVYANLAKVQQTTGISRRGMEALTNGIKNAAQNMRLLGKTGADIEKLTAQTARLVSSMEKVGVSAETAVGWVEKLTNPENIEDNIALYAQMGISIQDAITGNINPDQIANGMKDIGQKLKSMGAIAGTQYARQLGISYADAIKAVDAKPIGENDTGGNVKESEADAALKKASENMESMSEKLEKIGNQVKGWIMKLSPIFLGVFAFAFTQSDKLFGRVKTNIKETNASLTTETEATIGALTQNIGKAVTKITTRSGGKPGTLRYILFGDKSEMNKEKEELTNMVGNMFGNLGKENERKLLGDEIKYRLSIGKRIGERVKAYRKAERDDYNRRAQDYILQAAQEKELVNQKMKEYQRLADKNPMQKDYWEQMAKAAQDGMEKIGSDIEDVYRTLDEKNRKSVKDAIAGNVNEQQKLIDKLKNEKLEHQDNIRLLANEIKEKEQAGVHTLAEKKALQELKDLQEKETEAAKETNKKFKEAQDRLHNMKDEAAGVAKNLDDAGKSKPGTGLKSAEKSGLTSKSKQLSIQSGGGALGKMSKLLGKIGGKINGIFGMIQDPSQAITQLITTVISKLGPWGLLIAVALKALMPMIQKFIVPILKELGGTVMELLRLIMYPLFKFLMVVLTPVKWIANGIKALVDWIRKIFHITKEMTADEEEKEEEAKDDSKSSGPEIYTAGKRVSGTATGSPTTAGSKEIATKTADETKSVKEQAEKEKEAKQKEEEQKLMQNQSKMVFDIRKALSDVFGHTITGFGTPAINVNIAGMDGLNLVSGITQSIVSNNHKTASTDSQSPK